MQKELSFDDLTSDPLIAQLRRADGISTPDFASLLFAASDAYRASEIARLNDRRADLFYRTIGAGGLQEDERVRSLAIPGRQVENPIGCW